jgi:hypothetical protein
MPASTITMSAGRLNVPDEPILPFIEGDGTGPDIWRASVRVIDAAVAKAYAGKRKIHWKEVLAGEKAFNQTGNWLPDATLDQRIASGFHRCNITTNEGGVIEEEYRVLYARDRVETTGLAWMGLTVGCAVCHDHKFDPITQREFYQLSAFFNNTTQRVMDGNIKDPPPVIPVPLEADRERFFALDGLIGQAQQEVDNRRVQARPGFDTFLADATKRNEILWQSLPAQDALETHIPLRSPDLKAIAFVQAGQYQQIPLERDPVLAQGQISDTAWQVTPDLAPALPVEVVDRTGLEAAEGGHHDQAEERDAKPCAHGQRWHGIAAR